MSIVKDRVFTAQINKLYTVRYDGNGGTGDVRDPLRTLPMNLFQ